MYTQELRYSLYLQAMDDGLEEGSRGLVDVFFPRAFPTSFKTPGCFDVLSPPDKKRVSRCHVTHALLSSFP